MSYQNQTNKRYDNDYQSQHTKKNYLHKTTIKLE